MYSEYRVSNSDHSLNVDASRAKSRKSTRTRTQRCTAQKRAMLRKSWICLKTIGSSKTSKIIRYQTSWNWPSHLKKQSLNLASGPTFQSLTHLTALTSSCMGVWVFTTKMQRRWENYVRTKREWQLWLRQTQTVALTRKIKLKRTQSPPLNSNDRSKARQCEALRGPTSSQLRSVANVLAAARADLQLEPCGWRQPSVPSDHSRYAEIEYWAGWDSYGQNAHDQADARGK